MTDQQKKQKEIAVAFARFLDIKEDYTSAYDEFLTTEGGKRLTALDDEVAELRAWKETMITLWEPVISYAQNNYLPGLHPGQSISEYILSVFNRLTVEDRSEPEEPAINVLIKISKQLDRMEGDTKWRHERITIEGKEPSTVD